jgi:hypothetical protein
MAAGRLSLMEAREAGKLEEFIQQEEAAGVHAKSEEPFSRVITAAVRPPRSVDQTSRSPSRGGSPER